jgi:hypothetical protein
MEEITSVARIIKIATNNSSASDTITEEPPEIPINGFKLLS